MLEELVHSSIRILVTILEAAGVFIIVTGSVRSFWAYVKSHFHSDIHDAKLAFAQTLAFALEFKLAAEILKTVIAKDLGELFIIGLVIILRAILTCVIHYEIKFDTEHINMEKRLLEEQERIMEEEAATKHK